jgi:hypothetical protein
MLRPTVSRPVCLGIYHPPGAYGQIFITGRQLRVLMWGALSNERMGLSFIFAAGPRQRSHSRVRVPLDSWSYFTVSDSRLPFSSPPTTRKVTVEVFDTASTRYSMHCLFITANSPHRKHRLEGFRYRVLLMRCLGNNVFIPKQPFRFLSFYNSHCPHLQKPCFVITWFLGINLSVATCLPIRFLETANM